jgi:hypothetical protein
MLAQLKENLSWLRDQVLTAVRRGDARATVHQANLIPPGLLSGRPDALLPYLVLREHLIDRLYQQNTGYWRAGATLGGLDHLGNSGQAQYCSRELPREAQASKGPEISHGRHTPCKG